MKKYLALLLSMLLLVGCARIEPEQGGTKPEPGQPDDVSAKLLSQYALAEVKLPELPAAPRLPHTRLRRRGKREALPETAVPATAPAAPETIAIDGPAEPAPVTEPAPAAQPAPAEQAAAPAEPVRPAGPCVTLPSGWEHVLEDPNRLADDLALLTRALQDLSDDLRRPAADHKKEGER